MTGQGRLFRKFAVLFVGLVGGALLASGAVEGYFSYRETLSALARIQSEKAVTAATVIRQFIREIENQIEWTTHSSFLSGREGFEQRRIDFLRLLRQSPAITRISLLDHDGKERLSVSRLSMDVIDSGIDLSDKPEFKQAEARKLYVGPVYFRRNSEPYTTVSMAGPRKSAGVTVAEVNLKFVWDEIGQIRAGKHGYAYLVDSRGLLIAHPQVELVLRKTNMSILEHVRAALTNKTDDEDDNGAGPIATNIQGKKVLTAHVRIEPLGWTVFVESPLDEALGPIYESLGRTAVLILIGLALSILAGLVLARRVTVPIRALQEGAARIGAGDLSSKIEIRTGDELEALAAQFNHMADELHASYATLEQKVEERTGELTAALDRLRALGEVAQTVNSSLNIEQVLQTIIAHAVDLSETDAGNIYVYDEVTGALELRASLGMSEAFVDEFRKLGLDEQTSILTRTMQELKPVAIADTRALIDKLPRHEIMERAGFLAHLAVPLVRDSKAVGALVVQRKEPGKFDEETIELLQTFGRQSVLAIQNARLFREIEEKSRELEIASQHKSQFLANMSHELRTPMNAILGYTELVLDDIYGPTPEKVRGVLDRVRQNGQHLLALINDILDLSKIEAGELKMSLEDYSVSDMVHTVVAATESLATEKHLALETQLPNDLPVARGDERRIAQALLNLVGNAIKFTDEGRVEIRVTAENGSLAFEVTDTGPGIAPEQQDRIFEEFHQVDNSITKEKGGTGLGLAITKRIVEMHGGRIWIDSALGKGSTFGFAVPVRATQEQVA